MTDDESDDESNDESDDDPMILNNTGSFRINVKSKMAFMGINFHENWIFGVVSGCLHRDILIL